MRTFWKKYFFYSMFSPLVFGHSIRINMAEGGPKLKNQWGSTKMENVLIWLGNTHVHGEFQVQKNNLLTLF